MIEKEADYSEALNWTAELRRKEIFEVIYKKTQEECREDLVQKVQKAHFEAAYKGNLDIFKHICRYPEAVPLALDSSGDTFLHCAARNGHLRCMPFILEYMNRLVDIKGSFGETALMIALNNGEDEVVEWLLNQKADIHAVDDEGISCLHWAATCGNLHVVELCLDSGADVNKRDEKGRTALFQALETSQEHVVKFLLDYGANYGIPDNDGNTCLHAACQTNSMECVKLLVERQLSLKCTNSKGETPLQVARRKSRFAIVAFLLEEAKKTKHIEPVGGEKLP